MDERERQVCKNDALTSAFCNGARRSPEAIPPGVVLVVHRPRAWAAATSHT